MTDYFALLDEPRRPWIDLEQLKAKYLPLSSASHPDRFHGPDPAEREVATQRYAELNAAFNILREPKERLLHLLELESGEKPRDVQRIPPGTMDLFVEVGQLCRDVDSFLIEKNKVTSPMLKVQTFEKGMEWTDKLNLLQTQIEAKRQELENELKGLNSVWENAPPIDSVERAKSLPLERLEQMYRIFSYIARWNEQIRERIVQLAF